MIDFVQEYYLWIKALHIIAMVAWMAGMFYLPRLFVYHCDAEIGSDKSETFKVMERRLLRAIINPAMIATWVLGVLMLWVVVDLWENTDFLKAGWFHVKLTAVLLLSALHGLLSRHRKQFERDANVHSAKYYRILNEIPTVLLIIIIFMVVLRPF